MVGEKLLFVDGLPEDLAEERVEERVEDNRFISIIFRLVSSVFVLYKVPPSKEDLFNST